MKLVTFGSVSLITMIIIGSVLTGAAHAQPQEQAQGQGSAAQASVQGPANVNVVNVPTVTVGNTDLQPIPIKESLKQPVHANFHLIIEFGKGASPAGSLVIPAGKRLVIEHFAARCRSSSDTDVNFEVGANDGDLSYLLTTKVPFTAFPGDFLSFVTTPLAAIVDQGTVVVQAFRTSANETSDCAVAMTGYLTPLQ
jgi:hypothetical protein